jgi:polyisoprenoid-binding protein YceI
MKTTVFTYILALTFISSFGQKTEWSFDTKHSKIGFSVTHMMISEVEGQFTQYSGTVFADKTDFSDAKIKFVISPASINTDEPDRDKHLRSADFFNVEKFPEISFESSSMKSKGKNVFVLKGNMTMLGITKPVQLEARYNGTRKDPWGNTKAGFKISGTITRSDWGLKYNSVLDEGGVVIGDEVTINCNVELNKK